MPDERFFYTLDRPHRWTPGPIIVTIEDDGRPIPSLNRARELAAENRVDTRTEDRVETSYGVMYRSEEGD
jgi:hypothetical protein